MPKIVLLQPSEYTDHITADGTQLTTLPYPVGVHMDGSVTNQEFWQGDPYRVIGFQRDLARHEIDVWWSEVSRDPQKAVGLYLVTGDSKGGMGVHQTAISSVEVLGSE